MKIYIYGHPVLRKKANKVTNVDKKLLSIIDNMFKMMRNNIPRGIGLAATQVGILQSFFIYELDDDGGVVINPEILEKRGEKEKEEKDVYLFRMCTVLLKGHLRFLLGILISTEKSMKKK